MIPRYLRFILKRPLLPILLLAAATLYLGAGILKIEFDSSIESFMPKHDPEYIEYQEVKKTYGDNDRFVQMSIAHANLWSAPVLAAIDRLMADIEAYEDHRPALETRRLEKFRKAAHTPDATFAAILAEFQDDPAYARLLKRKIPKRLQKKTSLDPDAVQGMEKILLADAALKEHEIIDTVLSPLSAKDISGADDNLESYDLIGEDADGRRIMPQTPSEIAAFRERLTRNPAYAGRLYAVDAGTGDITDFAALIKFAGSRGQEEITSEIIDIVKTYPELEIYISGVPYVAKNFNNYIKADLFRNVPLIVLVVTLVFYLNFKSLRGVILPLATLGMAEIWTIGLMGHLGYKITSIGITLPPLLISVGSSYAIHVLNQYYADFHLIDPSEKRSGIRTAMTHISTTVFLAGFTTFAAFFSLVTNHVSAIQEWAVFAGLGVMFAVFISITLIPCCLALMPHQFPKALLHSDAERKVTLVERFLVVTARAATHHHKWIYAIVAVILAVAIAGALRLRVDTDILHYFKEDDPVKRNVRIAGDKFGGGWGFSIIIDSGEPDGVKSPEFQHTVEAVRTWLEADANMDLNVGRTDAFADFLKRMHMAMNNDEPAYFKIPDSRMDIMDYLEIYSGEDENSDGRFDEFEPFVDRRFQTNAILVRLTRKSESGMGTSEVKRIIAKIEAHLTRTLPPGYSFATTGYPTIEVKLAHYVVTGQLYGLLLSLGVVAIVIILLFRKFTAGPLALIDMGVTIIVNFGIMGWFGIDLDMVTSVIASITIGIGVDDTIHFLNTYRHFKTRDAGISETIEKTLFVAGKAIIFTSLALVAGFLVLLTSSFQPIVLFGILIAMTMVNTTIGSVLLVPAAIRLTGIQLDEKA
ncbi:MAG: efflux RND transporter permease subunit [Desulfococcus multivorans]|jgi:predicted RND superfamily exporter protein|nr:efflux RND transporter permease subunit [Desulfococcus multivorans]